MNELYQDEVYDEQSAGDGSYENESAENTSGGFDSFFGIPKNLFFPGVAVLVILILFVILFTTRGKSKDTSSDDIVYPTTDVTTDVAVQNPAEPLPVTQATQLFDSSGILLGTLDTVTDGSPVIDATGTTVGIFYVTSGEVPVFNNMQNPIGFMNYVPSAVDTTSSNLDTESIVQLRKLGYTGDEIELAISNGLSVEDLITEAQALRDAEAMEALKRIQDSASDEFKYMVANSIFCMEEIEYDAFDPNLDGATNMPGSYVVNADYYKCPTRGHQLFIKCKIANNTYVFYNVTPSRWETLPESGNIVLKIDYTMFGTQHVNMYITGVSEVNTTEITVNPEDSGSELSEILGQDNVVVDDSAVQDTPSQGIATDQVWW